MKLHELKSPQGVKERKRVGRGEASGHGGTSGRGHKGQKARSGGNIRPGFEGGQNPLHLRMPKIGGFKNPFKKEYLIVNVERLEAFKNNSIVDPEVLAKTGVVKKNSLVKILGKGEISKTLTVKAHKFSQLAVEKIGKAKGKVEFVSD